MKTRKIHHDFPDDPVISLESFYAIFCRFHNNKGSTVKITQVFALPAPGLSSITLSAQPQSQMQQHSRLGTVSLTLCPTSSLVGPRFVLVLAAPLPRWRMTGCASSSEAVLVRVGSVLLPVLFFLVLAFRRFLIILFLFLVLLFMGGQCILDGVN